MDEIEMKVKVIITLEDYIEFYGKKFGRKEYDKHHRQFMKISDRDIHSPTDVNSLLDH